MIKIMVCWIYKVPSVIFNRTGHKNRLRLKMISRFTIERFFTACAWWVAPPEDFFWSWLVHMLMCFVLNGFIFLYPHWRCLFFRELLYLNLVSSGLYPICRLWNGFRVFGQEFDYLGTFWWIWYVRLIVNAFGCFAGFAYKWSAVLLNRTYS